MLVRRYSSKGRQMIVDRRDFLKLSLLLTLPLPSAHAEAPSDWGPLTLNQMPTMPYEKYFRTQEEELDLIIPLPPALATRLKDQQAYRVGPGIYHRGNKLKRIALDADGMIRSYKFENGKLRFRNKHLRTKKWLEEEKANDFLYPSFAQTVPGLGIKNSFINIKNQAVVTVFTFGEKLFVSDEIQVLTQLDPDTFSVIDESSPHNLMLYAHTKQMSCDQNLHTLSFSPFTGSARFNRFDRDLKLDWHSANIKTHGSGIHDWFITEKYYVLVLSSLKTETSKIIQCALGKLPLTASVHFKDTPSQFIVISKASGKVVADQSFYPLQMWHGVNAYDHDGHVYLDIVGTSKNTFGLGPKSNAEKLMMGDESSLEELNSKLIQIEIDIQEATISERNKTWVSGFEMPTINEEFRGRDYRYFYALSGDEFLSTKIIKGDLKNQTFDSFDFGEGCFISEPLLLRDENTNLKEDSGILLVDVHDVKAGHNKLAFFDAAHVSSGPIAVLDLPAHLPTVFHGWVKPV